MTEARAIGVACLRGSRLRGPFSWDIAANCQYDPALQTEIEVRFFTKGGSRTRVEFEHRRLERYGDRRDEMRTIFEKTGDVAAAHSGFGVRLPATTGNPDFERIFRAHMNTHRRNRAWPRLN